MTTNCHDAEPTADMLIGMVERIARDPRLKAPYREHATRLASAMRVLPLHDGTEVILLLLGAHMARTDDEAEDQTVIKLWC